MKMIACLLATMVVAASAASDFPRSAHWVTRTSDLAKTIEFFTTVFGMKVIRHEENDKPCPITCNGDSPTAWSKTMVGYETEDKAYCFEVTYNYGVDSYPVGGGLASFTVAVDDLQAATTAASGLGYAARNNNKGGVMVVGPDGYRFLLVAKAGSARAAAEPFLGVKLHVADAAATAAFYTETLGMRVLGTGKLATGTAADGSLDAADIVLGYSEDQVALVVRGVGKPPRIEQHEGRHAISLPAATLQAVYKRIEAERPELIVHAIMELEETLGTLFIAIVKDPDGFEICLVSSETFDKAVLSAADWVGPNFALRERLIAERKAAATAAKAAKASAALVGLLGGRPRSTYAAYDPSGAGGDPTKPLPHPLVGRVKHVAAHVAGSLGAGTFSKTEGNFFAAGGLVGAAAVALLRAFRM